MIEQSVESFTRSDPHVMVTLGADMLIGLEIGSIQH
jgi:hypothetical protein